MSTVERYPALTLDDVGHDSKRERPVHKVPPGHEALPMRRTFCGIVLDDARKTMAMPGAVMCVVCEELARLYDAGWRS